MSHQVLHSQACKHGKGISLEDCPAIMLQHPLQGSLIWLQRRDVEKVRTANGHNAKLATPTPSLTQAPHVIL